MPVFIGTSPHFYPSLPSSVKQENRNNKDKLQPYNPRTQPQLAVGEHTLHALRILYSALRLLRGYIIL